VKSPFKIHGPAIVNFSGGRTSAFMLRRILDEGLEPGVIVGFADTHREREETYKFVDDVERRWGVKITRIERAGGFDKLLSDRAAGRAKRGEGPNLPGPVSRWCSVELKRSPAERLMLALAIRDGWATEDKKTGLMVASYDSIMGIRADEPSRVVKLRTRERERRPVYADGSEPWMYASAKEATPVGRVDAEYVLPLAEAGIVTGDVMCMWQGQDGLARPQGFDLELLQHEGNCDLCHLKAVWKRQDIMRRRPDLAAKWIHDEQVYAPALYRMGEASYAEQLKRATVRLPLFVDVGAEAAEECLCTD
jgi:hypothetical protein